MDPETKKGFNVFKYDVRRVNDFRGKHLHCRYFVLDLNHDKFSKAALTAYADACEQEYPLLAKDIRAMLSTL